MFVNDLHLNTKQHPKTLQYPSGGIKWILCEWIWKACVKTTSCDLRWTLNYNCNHTVSLISLKAKFIQQIIFMIVLVSEFLYVHFSFFVLSNGNFYKKIQSCINIKKIVNKYTKNSDTPILSVWKMRIIDSFC